MNAQKNRTVLVAVIAGVVFLLFLAGSLFFVFSVRRQNDEAIGAYLREATSQRRSAILQQMKGDVQVLSGVAISLGQMDFEDRESLNAILNQVNLSNSFVRMGFAGTGGTADLVDLSGQWVRDVDISRLAAYQTALAGQPGISEIFYEESTGQYVNYYTMPVTRDGRVVGVLCAVNTEDIPRAVVAVPVFQGVGHFAILNGDGHIVSPTVDPASKLEVGASIYNIIEIEDEQRAMLYAGLQNQTETDFVFYIGGEEQLATLMPLGVNGWSVISMAPHNTLNSYYNKTAVGTAGIIAAACLLFLFLLFWQLRAFSRNRKQLESLAFEDSLTGLRNYNKLILDAEKILADNPDQRFAIWSFDIRKFNTINDIFGAERGDLVLKRVAKVLSAEDGSDTISGHIAGDQFAGLRPYENKQELADWFWKAYGELDNRVVIAADEMSIDDVMGVYFVDDFSEKLTVEEMLNRAAIAKKEAKELSGNQVVFFTKELGAALHWEAELEAGGKTALETGQILFYLQPKVSIKGGFCITGAEALVRWKHPKHGLISPGEFIPLFEKNGFIVELDRYVFEAACKWLAEKQKQGMPPIQLAINVSRQGLLREDFLAYYSSVKEKYGLRDGVLELEFTESTVFDDYVRFHSLVETLRSAGFVCSIDDFGSGYSSLNVLKNLPIDVLKLDAVFFRGGDDVDRARVVISNFIAMAHQLGIKTVAEGVETQEQVRFLQRAGCDLIQGYVFSKPVPQSQFEQLLAEKGGAIQPQ